MPDPWDRPPIAPVGDASADITYTAVGRFLSQWEGLEIELSDLYAIFIGKYEKREAYEEYYNKSRTLSSRIKLLNESAYSFFIIHPSQTDEGDFSNLTARILGFSDRRHEIAHGIVRPYVAYAWLTEWSNPTDRDTTKTCLVPPYYQRNWHTEQFGLPKYVYIAIQIDRLTAKVADLVRDLSSFKGRFIPAL
jgi:hypothetical protein